jgi:hypothetical protein
MKNKNLKKVLRTKRLWHLPVAILGSAALLVSAAMFLMYSMAYPPSPVPSAWPSSGDWVKLTRNGDVVTDREARSSCTDNTAGANPSGMDDIGSQAKCSHSTRYNPGLYNQQTGIGFAASGAQQPNSTPDNTYSGAIFVDSSNMFFRVRLADDPEEHCSKFSHNCDETLQHNYWYFNLDVDANGTPDFYVKVYGDNGGDGKDDFIQVIHEETGND